MSRRSHEGPAPVAPREELEPHLNHHPSGRTSARMLESTLEPTRRTLPGLRYGYPPRPERQNLGYLRKSKISDLHLNLCEIKLSKGSLTSIECWRRRRWNGRRRRRLRGPEQALDGRRAVAGGAQTARAADARARPLRALGPLPFERRREVVDAVRERAVVLREPPRVPRPLVAVAEPRLELADLGADVLGLAREPPQARVALIRARLGRALGLARPAHVLLERLRPGAARRALALRRGERVLQSRGLGLAPLAVPPLGARAASASRRRRSCAASSSRCCSATSATPPSRSSTSPRPRSASAASARSAAASSRRALRSELSRASASARPSRARRSSSPSASSRASRPRRARRCSPFRSSPSVAAFSRASHRAAQASSRAAKARRSSSRSRRAARIWDLRSRSAARRRRARRLRARPRPLELDAGLVQRRAQRVDQRVLLRALQRADELGRLAAAGHCFWQCYEMGRTAAPVDPRAKRGRNPSNQRCNTSTSATVPRAASAQYLKY